MSLPIQPHSGPRYFGTAQKKSCFQSFDRNIPGPGAHSPQRKPTVSVPGWTVGTDTNRHTFLDPHLHQHPSPQHYSPKHSAIEKVSHKMSIPLSSYRMKTDINDMLFYPDQSPIKKACPQFSFGYFQQTDYSTDAPGPGAYETLREKIGHSKAQKGFSSGLRPPPYGESAKFPGPTSYAGMPAAIAPKYSFGRAPREGPKYRDPPARFYDVSADHRSTRLATWGPNDREWKPAFIPKNQVPAANVYHNQLPPNIPGGVMENSKRVPIENMATISFPSSDKYPQHKDLKTKKAQSFTKQQRKLSPKSKIIPGPGTYEPVPTLSKIGGVFSKKKSGENEEEVPGAASYYPKELAIRKKAASSVMLKAKRTDFSRSTTRAVGPGDYDIAKPSQTENTKIGSSHREHYYFPNQNPGVGDYTLPNFIGKLPNYCTSPKKVTEEGFSTLHQKMKAKLMLRQTMAKSMELRKKKSEPSSMMMSSNPEH